MEWTGEEDSGACNPLTVHVVTRQWEFDEMLRV